MYHICMLVCFSIPFHILNLKCWYQARALAELIAAGTQPIQNLGVLQKVSDKPEERAEWGRFWIDKGFTGMYLYPLGLTKLRNVFIYISVQFFSKVLSCFTCYTWENVMYKVLIIYSCLHVLLANIWALQPMAFKSDTYEHIKAVFLHTFCIHLIFWVSEKKSGKFKMHAGQPYWSIIMKRNSSVWNKIE